LNVSQLTQKEHTKLELHTECIFGIHRLVIKSATLRYETNPRIIARHAEVLLDSFMSDRASKQSMFTAIVASHVATTHIIRYFKYSAGKQNSQPKAVI
jgi:hypothetical protein